MGRQARTSMERRATRASTTSLVKQRNIAGTNLTKANKIIFKCFSHYCQLELNITICDLLFIHFMLPQVQVEWNNWPLKKVTPSWLVWNVHTCTEYPEFAPLGDSSSWNHMVMHWVINTQKTSSIRHHQLLPFEVYTQEKLYPDWHVWWKQFKFLQDISEKILGVHK